MVFEAVIQLLQDFGFFAIILPFLLIFALFYAVILKTKILGDPGEARTRTIATVIAMAAAFMVIVYTPVVNALATLVPQASFLLVVAMLFLMLLAFIVPNWETGLAKNKLWWGFAAVALFIVFLVLLGVSLGESVPSLYAFAQFMMGRIPLELTADAINLIIGFAVILGVPLLVIAMIVLSGRGGSGTTFKPGEIKIRD